MCCLFQIDTSLEARKLGYYLFWNIKQGRHSFNVTEDDMNALLDGKEAVQREQAWQMLDKNTDGAISMQEVMEATEDVYQCVSQSLTCCVVLPIWFYPSDRCVVLPIWFFTYQTAVWFYLSGLHMLCGFTYQTAPH